jgi:hypothetical protein
MKSYKDIVDTFRTICDQHEKITTFTTGDIFEADLESTDVFTKAHLVETSATINKATFTFTFDLLIMDLVDVDDSDIEYRLNETFLILADIFREFRTGSYSNTSAVTQDIVMPESLSCDPFTDQFENLLAGWKGTFNITVPSHNTACTSPMDRS